MTFSRALAAALLAALLASPEPQADPLPAVDALVRAEMGRQRIPGVAVVKDLIAWDAGVRAGRILKAASWASVFEPVRLNDGKTHGYGFGWAVGVRGGQPAYQHGGSWQGFKTHYARFDRGDLSVIALANLTQADPAKIVDGIAALVDPPLAPSR